MLEYQLCNDAEYKNMDQDENQGQLYDVHIWIKIIYKQSGWAYSFSTTKLYFPFSPTDPFPSLRVPWQG